MEKTFTAKATVAIHAPASKVWQALTDPELIKQYLFGSEVITDWKVGSPIIYRGMWQGKPFEDKGKVLQVKPEKLLEVSHWSPLSGVPDTPENYHKVTYELAPEDGGTRVTILQDNNASEEERAHSEQNWNLVLGNLKKLLEQ
ncbi:MAG TPA: SRPBCC domain-containing protein [Anaerolineae bacterium]|nr:SRPBCC domain-containing protein [Anaerolineae bacterium]